MIAVIYKTATGEIVGIVSAPESVIGLQCGSGERYIEGHADDARQYVDLDTLAVVDKPAMPVSGFTPDTVAADGYTAVEYTGFPVGALVSVDGPVPGRGVIDDGRLELVFYEPGEYRIRASLFPYLDWEVVIHAA